MGDNVTHINHGLGKILNITKKKITIQFVDGKKEIAMVLADKFLKK